MTNDAASRLAIRWGGVCLDCANAEDMARFYGAVFGWHVTARDARRGPPGRIRLGRDERPGGRPDGVVPGRGLVRAADLARGPRRPTKMMHFEVAVDDLNAAVALVVQAGGRDAPNRKTGTPRTCA